MAGVVRRSGLLRRSLACRNRVELAQRRNAQLRRRRGPSAHCAARPGFAPAWVHATGISLAAAAPSADAALCADLPMVGQRHCGPDPLGAGLHGRMRRHLPADAAPVCSACRGNGSGLLRPQSESIRRYSSSGNAWIRRRSLARHARWPRSGRASLPGPTACRSPHW